VLVGVFGIAIAQRWPHLHRVARIFKNGVGDAERAEGALNLALDGAPTNDEALAHLHRVARIVKNGFGDAKRAQGALNLALDGARTNTRRSPTSTGSPGSSRTGSATPSGPGARQPGARRRATNTRRSPRAQQAGAMAWLAFSASRSRSRRLGPQ